VKLNAASRLLAAEYKLRVGTPSKLGVSRVYRTEKPDSFYKGKAIWGKGKYFSLSKEESERINDGGEIKEYKLPNTLKLADFDLTWRTDSDRSDADYAAIGALIGKPPVGVDGYVIRSNSVQYGFSQVVIFPSALDKIKGLV
jgi:hypothetical protein